MILFTLAVLWTRSAAHAQPDRRPGYRDRQRVAWFPWFLGFFLCIFAATGIGNGSTYKMIPAIWRSEAERATTPHRRARGRARRRDPAVVGGARRHRRGRRARRLPHPDRLLLALGRRPAAAATKGAFAAFAAFYVGLRGSSPGRATCAGLPRADQPRARRDRMTDATTHPLSLLLAAVRHDARRTGVSGRGLEVQPWPEFPVNAGALCRKGWTATGLRGSRERLTTPLLRDRDTGELRGRVLGRGARRRRRAGCAPCKAASGPDGVAVFGGGGLTNEKAYQLGKFARVDARTSHIDYNGRWCMSSAAAAAPGLRARPGSALPALRHRGGRSRRCSWARNLAETMPPAARHLTGARARRSARRRRPALHPTADGPTSSSSRPGTDLALAIGLLHLLAGKAHRPRLRRRTHERLRRRRRSCATSWPERVERVTGVPSTQHGAPADLLARAPSRDGADRAAAPSSTPRATDTVLAWINVALALGQVRQAAQRLRLPDGSGQRPGRPRARPEGGPTAGLPPDRGPGRARHVAAVWGVDPQRAARPGRSAYELLDALGTAGGLRACWSSAPTSPSRRPTRPTSSDRLAALDLLVVADSSVRDRGARRCGAAGRRSGPRRPAR